MVAAAKRCLSSREAHPKAHDIPARNTGSQVSYLWQRAEKKPDYERVYEPAKSGKRQVAVRQSEQLDDWTTFCKPSAGAAGRLDIIL